MSLSLSDKREAILQTTRYELDSPWIPSREKKLSTLPLIDTLTDSNF